MLLLCQSSGRGGGSGFSSDGTKGQHKVELWWCGRYGYLLTCFKVDLSAMLIHNFNKLSKSEQTLTLRKMIMEFSGKWRQWKHMSLISQIHNAFQFFIHYSTIRFTNLFLCCVFDHTA